jgi:hypothetical protein
MSKILKGLMLVCCFIAAVPSASFCQKGRVLTVRVLDARNGKTLKQVRRWLTGRPRINAPWIELCSGWEVSMDQVLAKGRAGANGCGGAKFSGTPAPGE